MGWRNKFGSVLPKTVKTWFSFSGLGLLDGISLFSPYRFSPFSLISDIGTEYLKIIVFIQDSKLPVGD